MGNAISLTRRAVLKGLGVICALPYLECMANSKTEPVLAPRLCFLSVPNGVSLPAADSPDKEWRWFPEGHGRDYHFTNVLSSLEPHRHDLTVIGGLSHPKSRQLMGHMAGDTFLTGGDLRGHQYNNTISVDQVAAEQLKHHTRYPFLALSVDGGVGYKSRVSTLSFNHNGLPVPSEHQPRAIFERYFSPHRGGLTQDRRRALALNQKIVDMVLEDSKQLHKQLGQSDRDKLDEYLASLNQVEEQIKRDEKWLDIPMKFFDSSQLQLDINVELDPQGYIRTLLDLMVIAFQTDSTRVSTYMIGREDGIGLGDKFPRLALGLRDHHAISHFKGEGRWKEWGRYDQWLASHVAYFIDRLKNTVSTLR